MLRASAPGDKVEFPRADLLRQEIETGGPHARGKGEEKRRAIMLIRIRPDWWLPASAATPERLVTDRRRVLAAMGQFAAGAAAAAVIGGGPAPGRAETRCPPRFHEAIPAPRNPAYLLPDERITAFDAATRYNNYYEFGLEKEAPAEHAQALQTCPWTITVDGLVERPGVYDLDSLIDADRLEERVYRFRCVEAWSMVVPWIGVPLARVLAKLGPAPGARYVAFESHLDRAVMPGTRIPVLAWPYREGLRLDEAMHPLTLLAVGMYGKPLPKQNGAPIRLVVPWKYGFKSIKAIRRITLLARQPATSWNTAAPHEYGFYANVNPEVDHPRWSQKRERRLGEIFRRPTLPFNGYASQVASLYAGMDLRRFF